MKTAIKNLISKTDSKLTARYGKRMGRVALVAFVVGLPIPLPMASMMTAAPVLLVAELVRLAK